MTHPCDHCGFLHDPDAADPCVCSACGHKFCVWWFGTGVILCPECSSPCYTRVSDLGKSMQHPFEVLIDTDGKAERDKP